MPVQEPYPATVPTKGKKSKKLVTKRRARTAAEFGVRRCSDRICCVASRMLLGQLRGCNIYLREWELQRGLPREHRSDNAALCACFMLLLARSCCGRNSAWVSFLAALTTRRS